MARQHLKQRSDGRYACRADGLWFYGATEKEALEKRKAYQRMIENGLRVEAFGVTVQDYAQKWLPANKNTVSNQTYNNYAHILNMLCKRIGYKRMVDVIPSDIKSFYSEEFATYSEAHIRRAKNIFTSMFDSAVDDGLCVKNPCRAKSAQPHKGTAGTHRCITQEEISLINTTEHRLRPLVMLMLYAGLRRGEALGIDVERDVDFDSAEITVNGAVHFDNAGGAIYTNAGKTDAALRTIPLFLPLLHALSGMTGRVGLSVKGEPMSLSAFRFGWKSYMKTLSAAAGHEIKIRPHDLRHTFCTFLCFSGVDLKTAMLWMGHSDEKMILKIYDHVNPERIEKEAQKVKKMLLGSQNGSQMQSITSETLDL